MVDSTDGSVRARAAKLALLGLYAAAAIGGRSAARAEDDAPAAGAEAPPAKIRKPVPKPIPKKHAHTAAKPAVQKPIADKRRPPPPAAAAQGAASPGSVAAPITPAPPPAAAAVAPAAPLAYAQQLRSGGVGSCLARVQQLGQATAAGVATFGTVSNWHAKAPDQRIVNVLVGQKFANPNVPFGLAGIFAAPAPNGRCDGYSIQIIPSPLSCADLQKSILAHGKAMATLAGLPLMQDASDSQVTLMPTAGNGCVVVGLRAAYTE